MYTSKKKKCQVCFEIKKLQTKTLCTWCYERTLAGTRIETTCKTFKPASEYNNYLFENFIRYIKRYALRSKSAQQTEAMARLLGSTPLEPIKGWSDIYALKQHHPPELPRKSLVKDGHPYHKLGYMLEELGVISPRAEMLDRRIKTQLERFAPQDRQAVEKFISWVQNQKCKTKNIVENLRPLACLDEWARKRKKTLFNIEPKDYTDYVAELRTQFRSQTSATQAHYRIARFYRWLVAEKQLAKSPAQNLKMPLHPKRHIVCSAEDLKKLSRFIRNQSSDPEQAFVLALVLTWGLTYDELLFAQLDLTGGRLSIVLRAKELTYQKRTVRPQVIALPPSPKWFKQLSERYLVHWQRHYKLVKRTTARQPLLVTHNHQYNRPVSREWLRKRILKATTQATGKAIPATVLRKTCASLYVKHNDASMLRALGWSKTAAFTYVWTPKVIF